MAYDDPLMQVIDTVLTEYYDSSTKGVTSLKFEQSWKKH